MGRRMMHNVSSSLHIFHVVEYLDFKNGFGKIFVKACYNDLVNPSIVYQEHKMRSTLAIALLFFAFTAFI